MKDGKKILVAVLPAVAAAGITFLLVRHSRRVKHYERKRQIADEGYETAGDVLFPMKNQSAKYKTAWK